MSDTIRLLLCDYLYGWLNGSLCSRINIWRKESRPMQRRLITSASQVSTYFWPHNVFQEKKKASHERTSSELKPIWTGFNSANKHTVFTFCSTVSVPFQLGVKDFSSTVSFSLLAVCCIQEFTFGEEFKRQAESVEHVWTDNTKTCKNFPSDY